MDDLKNKLQVIAKKAGFSLQLQMEHDGNFMEGKFHKDGVNLYVAIPKHDGKFHVYTLESPGLPRELYPDKAREGISNQQRNDEILTNIEDLLQKKIAFTPKPGTFKKEAGFIELPVDGVTRKIKQNRNYFGLPLA
jgi:hypothetical protein